MSAMADKAAASLGMKPATLKVYKSVAEAYPESSMRIDDCSFKHHQIAAPLPTETRQQVLSAAAAQGKNLESTTRGSRLLRTTGFDVETRRDSSKASMASAEKKSRGRLAPGARRSMAISSPADTNFLASRGDIPRWSQNALRLRCVRSAPANDAPPEMAAWRRFAIANIEATYLQRIPPNGVWPQATELPMGNEGEDAG